MDSTLVSGLVAAGAAIVSAWLSHKATLSAVKEQEITRQRNAVMSMVMELLENKHVSEKTTSGSPIKFATECWDDSKGYLSAFFNDFELIESFRHLYSLAKKANVVVDRMVSDPNSRSSGYWSDPYDRSVKETRKEIDKTIDKLKNDKEVMSLFPNLIRILENDRK